MADSLVLKGVKDVKKRTGTGMILRKPSRGGDTHQIKEWWRNSVNTVYASCSVIKISTSDGVVNLAIATGGREGAFIRIVHDGDFGFTFYDVKDIQRAALFNDQMQIIEHYMFPAIAGGSIVTVTPSGAASRPTTTVPFVFTGNTTIAGTPTVGETLTATAATFTGGTGTITTNMVFQVSATGTSGWSNLASTSGVASGGTATYVITSSEAGKYIRAHYTITDDVGTTNKNSSATSVIAETLATRIANATYTYVVTVVNTAAEGDPAVNVFALNGTNQLAVSASAGESIAFDFSADASNHPLDIFTDATKTTPVTVGVETGGPGNATLLFTPPIAGSFSYQCINHANMGGDITVS